MTETLTTAPFEVIHERRIDPAFKAAWIAELRSGNYPQGDMVLHRVSAANWRKDDTYCCLGVACEMLAGAGILNRKVFGGNVIFSDPTNEDSKEYSAAFPPDVIEGLTDFGDLGIRLDIPGNYKVVPSLSSFNDDPSGFFTFDRIADIIEYFL